MSETNTEGDATERDLIARIRIGDQDAFSAVYQTFYSGLWRFAVHQSKSEDLAHDVVNTVFLGVWTHRDHWHPTSLKAYLYGAVRHELQKVARHRNVIDRTTPYVEQSYAEHGGSLSTVRPDEAAEFADLRDRIRHAIAQLPERQRIAMHLRWIEELTVAEIAEAMGISHPPVVRLLAKAQQALRQALGPSDGDERN
jgi:RNA polymerase sigma factor (sigma-70 family)